MARIRHRDFSKGWFIAGGREAGPPGTLRQALGIRTILTPHIRSRWGHQSYIDLGAANVNLHSLVTFINARIAGVGSNLLVAFTQSGQAVFYNALSPVVPALSLSGLRLKFAKMIPTQDAKVERFQAGPDHLIVVGGGLASDGGKHPQGRPFKIDTNGGISDYGIQGPPPNAATALQVNKGVIIGGKLIVDLIIGIDEFDSAGVAGGWVASGSGTTITNDFGVKQSGAQSMAFAVPADSVGVTAKFKAANLRDINNIVSAKEDWIQFWVHCDQPKNLDVLEILFDVSDAATSPAPAVPTALTGVNDTYSFQVLVDDSVSGTSPITGIGDTPEFADERGDTPQPGGTRLLDNTEVARLAQEKLGGKRKVIKEGSSRAAIDSIVRDLGTTRIAPTANTWTLVRIPKASFTATGKAALDDRWSSVRRVIFTMISNENGSVTTRLDALGLVVGAGMHGDYQCAYTYKNSKTGQRSNPSAITKVTGVKRNGLTWRGFLLSPDPQVDTIECWRTVGNGNILFHAEDLIHANNGPGTFHTDIVADFPGLQEEVKTAFGRNTIYLDPEELPYDNVKPPQTLRDICGPYQGVLFMIDGKIGERGKLLYTPPARPESIAGFIFITSDDDSLQRCIYWNGVYCFSESGIHEIVGTPPGPYVAQRIFGAPGTILPESVVPTPFGIVYLAQDGVRVFNGTTSDLVAPDAVLPLFRGELSGDTGAAHTSLAVTTCNCAAYRNEEYIFSTNFACYAVNLRTGVWREVGGSYTTFYYEPDTGVLLGAALNDSRILLFERPNTVVDPSGGINFAVEVPGTVVEDQSGQTKLVQRMYLDLNTRGGSLVPVIHYSGSGTSVSSLTLATIVTGANRTMVEVSLGQPGDIIGVELSGALVQPVDIFGIEFDVHLPEQGGSLT